MTITTAVKRYTLKSNNFYWRYLAVLCGILVISMCAGCATSSTTMVEEELVTNPKPMYRYNSLVVRDLELKKELYADSADAVLSGRELRYAKLPKELTEHVLRYVNSRRIYKQVTREGAANGETLVLTGRFTRVGRFKISVVVSLRDGASNEEVAYFRQTLWDVLDTTDTVSELGREIADFISRIQYK